MINYLCGRNEKIKNNISPLLRRMKSNTNELTNDFLQLARIALTGRAQDVQLFLHRMSKKAKGSLPELTDGLVDLLKESPNALSPLRKNSEAPLPVDIDSRLQLLRIEKDYLEYGPILSSSTQDAINQIILERTHTSSLLKHGLLPTKSILLTGPPGVGKTMAAKWIASRLKKPLLVLDLAAVMSSFLGRTGNNIRHVLDYAKNTECVLLLDELDAIAKRRDDTTEIGELKRLVTVLLQEIDDWPASGLLIGATNHPALLDPAIWRRFEVVLSFDNPTPDQIEEQVVLLLKDEVKNPELWGSILGVALNGKSFSDIERIITITRKSAAINNISLEEKLKDLIMLGEDADHGQKVKLACLLVDKKILSQRQAHELTGVSRDTIRKNMKK